VAVRSLSVVSLLACALAFPVGARAEPPEHALSNPERAHRLWIRGIGYMGEPDDTKVLMGAPRFGGAFLLADKVDLAVEMPLVFATIDAPDSSEVETRVAAGNPFVGASYVSSEGAHRFSLGAGAAAPVAHDKDDDAFDQLAFAYARAARAGRESWLYTPDRLALVASGTFETKVERGPVVSGDLALAMMPRVRGDGSALVSTTQIGVAVAAQLGESVQLGGRLDGVLLPSDMTERLQGALVPFMRVSTHDGVMFAMELVMPLDDPYGLAFKDGGFWGLSLLAGSRF
jgi:hypothetical protein